jgi:hypothetical protein
MALTMTRTRTQTALTKLVTLIANVHGELAFVDSQAAMLTGTPFKPNRDALLAGIARRREQLKGSRDALYTTIRQFDPELEPASIGSADGWLKPFGRGATGGKRYLASLVDAGQG